ncbi:hypothetical protein Acor_14140 [Acrocarpospora corrugata]|uniref:DUF4397 domain-containing protein n=1 Tax=Acrocarpospora corrugata TaxID=35763 RepID=A0A5M3VX45_9ACTN|nr:DUF4397 domain-containing protein [Acrocarpospora corrugata]GER99350.1 hypothetical protein Acor_14140 [Acrocarpospora corrugata]
MILPRIALLVTFFLGLSIPAHAESAAVGHVRLAHLSPDTPAVDVYLYPFGGSAPKLVLKAVPYGGVSPYQNLNAGQYTVAMRPAGAGASTPPVLSANVRVAGGNAYTVAGMGPYQSIRLQVLPDSMALPSGKAGLRVIAASLKERTLKVTAGGAVFEEELRFANTPDYRPVDAATQKITVAAGSGSASADVVLAPGSTNTVVVLDGKSGLDILSLQDAAAPGVTPKGAVDTGLGGLATRDTPRGIGVAIVLAGIALTLSVVLRRRRVT